MLKSFTNNRSNVSMPVRLHDLFVLELSNIEITKEVLPNLIYYSENYGDIKL